MFYQLHPTFFNPETPRNMNLQAPHPVIHGLNHITDLPLTHPHLYPPRSPPTSRKGDPSKESL